MRCALYRHSLPAGSTNRRDSHRLASAVVRCSSFDVDAIVFRTDSYSWKYQGSVFATRSTGQVRVAAVAPEHRAWIHRAVPYIQTRLPLSNLDSDGRHH